MLQIEGSKRWLIRPPLESHTLPLSYLPREPVAPMSVNDEGTIEEILLPGSLLYIPRGQPRSAAWTQGALDGSRI